MVIRKGQAFTADLFTAYTIFVIILLMIMGVAVWVANTLHEIEENDKMQRLAISAADYMVYSSNFTTEPYVFNKTRIDSFLSKSEGELSSIFHFENYNYTIRIEQVNRAGLIQAGNSTTEPEKAIVAERIVRYNNQNSRLVVTLWQID